MDESHGIEETIKFGDEDVGVGLNHDGLVTKFKDDQLAIDVIRELTGIDICHDAINFAGGELATTTFDEVVIGTDHCIKASVTNGNAKSVDRSSANRFDLGRI